jgi:hypothetical protein
VRRAFIYLASLAGVLILWVEAAHYAKHRHWIGYGWHVDVISVSADPGNPGSRLLWARIQNLTFSARAVELCVLPSDISTPQAGVSPLFDVQKRSGATGIWERVFPNTQVECPAQTVSRTIVPLGSYDTQAAAFAVDGFKTGDYVRFAIIRSAGLVNDTPPTLLSSPFPIAGEGHH